MFLKVFYGDDIKVYRDIDNTFFRTRSEDGLMSLQFDISPDHELYRYFALYGSVEYDGQRYLINGINERKTVSTILVSLTSRDSTIMFIRPIIRAPLAFQAYARRF